MDGKSKALRECFEDLGYLIKDIRYYTTEDLSYIANKLEEAYDELLPIVFPDGEEAEEEEDEE